MIPTFFNIGYSKWMPGTLASFAALALAIPLVVVYGRFPLLIMFLMLTGLYFFSVPQILVETNEKDPSFVVADEVLGQWLVVLLLPSLNATYFMLSFVLFRVFDILKPYPIYVYDLKSRRGSYRSQAYYILFDDILAGIFALLCIWLGLILLETLRIL